MRRAHRSRVSRPRKDRLPGPTHRDKMPPWAPWRALSVVLILTWARPPDALACPHPCACYVPTEVHCTFRSLASVPAGISKHVERINLGFNSIQALSETSFAGLTKLELLMVHGNNIPSIPDGALRDLSSLQVLKCSYNKVRVLTAHTLRGLGSLLRLHLDHNQLEFIHPQAFRGLTSLRLLHLEGNHLQLLHPATFATFSFLDSFRLSNIRHLYLAENRLSSLPAGLLRNMPLLETLYLQGNPWACDCGLRGLLRWEAQAPGILKCKKDKAYEGGQLCAVCSGPKKLQGQEIHKLQDITCQKPSIASPLRHNSSEDDPDPEDDGDSPWSLAAFQSPPWNISLNMTDEHGNTVTLACGIQKPTELYRVHLNQTEAHEVDVNATVALDLDCPMTRENYEKLWKLIAYYSEVPVRLHRELALGADGGGGSQYRQLAHDDALYYTGVRAHVLAEPDWVMQPSFDLQLNRRQSTAKKVRLSYRAQFSVTVGSKEAAQSRSRSWVMIEPGAAERRAHTVLEGAPCQLSCNVKASESPSIFWVLPDGSVLKAPTDDQDGKFSILTSGWLTIRYTEQSDSGVYRCVARVRDETDQVAHRVSVQPLATQPAGRHTVTVEKSPGDPVTLPCQALAVPEAQLSWILPNKRIVNGLANTSQAYMLPNGTLFIPKVQASDGGYYRCVAVNQQGADHFTVGVTVTKKGSGRSSKRGRRPGGKTLSRVRGDVVEDEGGSGLGEGDASSRRTPPPKGRKLVLDTKDDASPKKGRRKLKPWRNSEKEPETNVAEGRRVFESRRRVSMANKQINPEHWADILARVRGKNLPRGTEGPGAMRTTTPPSAGRDVTPAVPVASPPSVTLAQTSTSAEEFSADAVLPGEDEAVSRGVSASRGTPQHGLEEARETSTDVGDVTDEDLSEKTEDPVPTDADPTWAAATQPTSPAPHGPAAPGILDAPQEPPRENPATEDRSGLALGPVPQPPSRGHEPPLETTSLAASVPAPSVYPEQETNSEPDAEKVEEHPSGRSTPTPAWSVVDSTTPEPTPAWSVVDSTTPEPFGGLAPGRPHVPARGRAEQQTRRPEPAGNGFSAESHAPLEKGAEEDSLKRPEGNGLERGPKKSRRPQSKNPTLAPVTWGLRTTVTAFPSPGETTPGFFLHRGTTPASTVMPVPKATPPPEPTTHRSRKRPNGRRRLRPHKFRQRHKQAPPETLAPSEAFSAPPTPASEGKTSAHADGLPAPTSRVESRVPLTQQVETEQHGDPVTRGTPRRKHGRRPNRNRHNTSTVSSTASASTLRPSSENRQRAVITTPGPETVRAPTTIARTTGDPREVTSMADDATTTTKIPVSPDTSQETVPATDKPDNRETENYAVTDVADPKTHGLGPGEVVVGVSSPSVPEVSPVGEFQEDSSPSMFPGTEAWNPPKTAQPGRPQTDTPVTRSSEGLADSAPFLEELEDLEFTSQVPTSMAASTPSQEDEVLAATTLASTEPPSGTAGSSSRGQDDRETSPAVVRAETRPQHQVPTPAPADAATSSSPRTTLVPSVPTPTEPARGAWRASPGPTESKGHVFFNAVGIPETQTPPVPREGTRQMWRDNEVSTPSPKKDEFHGTLRQELGKEALDEGMRNSLPRGPGVHPQDGRLHLFQQPARVPAAPVPPRGTARPPPRTTHSSVRHLGTAQPPGHLTNKPGITAYPSRALPDNRHSTTPKLSSPPTPLDPWRFSRPDTFPDQGTDRFGGHSKAFGNNNLPDFRDPGAKLPNSRLPPYFNGRLPFFVNRTFSFPQLGVTRPPTATPGAPAMRERNVNPGAHNRLPSQTITHVDFGPPAPPLLHRPRTVSPHSTHIQNVILVSPTRSSFPFTMSPGPPSRSPHDGSSNLSPGGPPAPKFWTLGERPQIITASPQTVSVTAETDAVLPCEATGKPPPFITWTKVSTGALLTPNTRVQRFEVLKNGTFVIRKVQVQDRGQYMCTAKNLHGVDRMVVTLSVSVQQPQILASHYQDVTVYLGDTIAMECLAKGTPAPQISWIFPDRSVWQTVSPVEGRVTLHENRTLSIKEASFADRGVYNCVASNAAGADSLAIRLHVAALPPVIHQEKVENISLPPGLSIHIHCTAKAAPLPSVRWVLWDGTQIRPSQFINGNLFVFPNGTLYIRNLAPKDSGRYECVAANVVGSARRTVQLTVRRAAANARITGTSPQRTNVHYGGTLRLDCSASGDPWPRILWRLPSKQMIDALFSFDTRVKVFANGTLVVKSVTDKDAGDYLCVARNKVGDDFVVLKVNVVMKPAKIQHKEDGDHRVFYGGDLKVDCVASGLPSPEISWSLPDGSLVHSFMQSDDSGGRTKRFVLFHNGTLYLNEVGMREEGEYTCFAENQVGKDEMTVRVKVVAEPAVIRNKTFSVVQVPYGDVVTVACEAKGEPTPRVTWLSPTNRLIPTSSEKYQIYQDGTLLIQKAQRSDSGNYTCVVRNSAGEDRKAVWIRVDVQSPTINGNPNAITTVREIAAGGSRKLIDCQARGVPTPKVLWAFPEGVVLPAPYYGNRVTIHRNGTLDIKSLRKSDSVQLTCIGRNEGGEARLIVQLTVLEAMEKPVFHDPVSDKITAMAGHTISLNCSAAGTPTPTLVWVLPNGTELQSGRQLQRFFHKGDGMLHISGLSSADAGAYRCVARNAAGHTERLVSLKVGLKAETHKQYHNLVSIINGETLHLPCLPPAGRPARFSWTLPNGLALQGPQTRGRFSLWDNGTLTVREASVFDRGTYVCKTDSAHGPSVVSVPVIVIAYPPRITSEPTPVIYTRPGNTVKMSCMAMGIPKAEITWELPDKSHLKAGSQARLYGNRFLHPQGALTIQHTTQRDAGFYKCTAKNILGSDSKTTYIHVY